MASSARLLLLFTWLLIVSPPCSAVRLKSRPRQFYDIPGEGQTGNDTREISAPPVADGPKTHQFQLWASKIWGVGYFTAYHTSVMIDDEELVWGADGLFRHKGLRSHLSEATEVTEVRKSTIYGADLFMNSMRRNFEQGSYDFIYKNCNSFSDVATSWFANERIPEYLNRWDNYAQDHPDQFENIANSRLVQRFVRGKYRPNPKVGDFDKETLILSIKHNILRPAVEESLRPPAKQQDQQEQQEQQEQQPQGQDGAAESGEWGAMAEAAVERVLGFFENQRNETAPQFQRVTRPEPQGSAVAGAFPATMQNPPSMSSVRIAAGEIRGIAADARMHCAGANASRAKLEKAIWKRAQQIEKRVHLIKKGDTVWLPSPTYHRRLTRQKTSQGNFSETSGILVGIVEAVSEGEVLGGFVIPAGSPRVTYYGEFWPILGQRKPGKYIPPQDAKKLFFLNKQMPVWAWSNTKSRWRQAEILDFAGDILGSERTDGALPDGSVYVKYVDVDHGDKKWIHRDQAPAFISKHEPESKTV